MKFPEDSNEPGKTLFHGCSQSGPRRASRSPETINITGPKLLNIYC